MKINNIKFKARLDYGEYEEINEVINGLEEEIEDYYKEYMDEYNTQKENGEYSNLADYLVSCKDLTYFEIAENVLKKSMDTDTREHFLEEDENSDYVRLNYIEVEEE
jgi:hypothetical protein